MDQSFVDDSFDDEIDEEELLAKANEKWAINRYVTTVETNRPRQVNLDGQFIRETDSQGNPVEYRQIQNIITFGPTHHELNEANLGTYIYPTNLEIRDYQYDIVAKALFKNVLCAMPTGLGKTFIASTVMLNFYRWTKTAKIVFMAPTRPLVAQQIKACYEITGIPSHDTAILLDKVKKNRAEIWESKRVFFTTPQVVENDLKNGFINPKDIVCLVIDEAHRARGNYAYRNVVTFMRRFTSSFRILALTATPASDINGVQELIDNLSISKVELRTEESVDTAKYMKKKDITRIHCSPNEKMMQIIDLLADAVDGTLQKCIKFKIYEGTDPYKVNAFQAMEASQKVVRNPTISEGLKWMYYFLLQILVVAGQGFRRINIYGIRSFYSYFNDKFLEFTAKWETKKSKNQYAADFYYHPSVKKLLKLTENFITEDDNLSRLGQGTSGLFSHTKFENMVEELSDFFANTDKSDSRVIIFTEFRESALEIVKVIDTYSANHRAELAKELKPHIFIGQAREKDKFDDVEFRKKLAPKKRGGKKKKDIELEKELKELEKENAKLLKAELLKQRAGSRVGSSEMAQEQGMNQQQQKDLINDFKKGVYNIIVATSIGEEGLDIGEVDLIICFDSTSSPIKNIQRMGRTGRKRDGKVVFLFSSNEESKYEKAMGGYMYIQQQIQSGQNIKYEPSDRILPKDCQPIVEKKLIEIPEENDELLQLADEDSDEFLKRATQLTLAGKKKGKGKKDTKGQKKLTKRFFMPDNVETGFQNASSLVQKVSKEKPISLLDDDEELFANTSKQSVDAADASYVSISDLKKQKNSGETSLHSIIIDDDQEDELDALIVKDHNFDNTFDFLNSSLPSSPIDLPESHSEINKENHISTKPKQNIIQPAVTTQRKRTLGATKRGSVNVIESLKRQVKERPFRPIIVNKFDQPIIVDEESQRSEPPLKKLKSSQLDIPLDPIIDPSQYSGSDGYLTPSELEDFYNRCQTCAVHIDDKFFEPNASKEVTGGIGHSSKMIRFLEFISQCK